MTLGEHEVAELLGVKRETVHQWRFRDLMPEADHTVNGKPAWDRSTIERWAKATDRWPAATA